MQTLTKGPIVKTILKLAIPIMASSFLGTLYNICDMAWVGTLGSKTVAGVGVGGMYLWLASGIAMLPRMGGQVLTAQSIGSGKIEKAKGYVRSSVQIIIVLSVIVGILSLLFTKQLIVFFQLTDAESYSVAYRYLQITCGLIIFNFVNFTLSGLCTADGDSKTPMIANFIGLVLNMILDPLLIIGPWFFPRLGATGAAIATVFSQVVVLVILILKIKNMKSGSGVFHNQNYLKKCSKDDYVSIVKMGLPTAIQSMFFCFISMLLTRFVSGFGPEAVAVFRVGGQIESVSWNTADGFSTAVNSFCAQNFGAKEYRRIKTGYVFSLGTVFAWGALVLLCFVIFPMQISSFFFHEELVLACSVTYLTIIGFSEPFLMCEIVTEGALAGLGRTKLCSTLSIVLSAIRIPMAYYLMQTSFGLNGIWWTCTITSIIKGLVLVLTFFIVSPGKRYKEQA